MVAGDGHSANIGTRRKQGFVGRRAAFLYDRNPPLAERVLRERRHVAAARQEHRLAARQHARIALGDDVETFHCGMISPLWPTCARMKRYSPPPRFRTTATRSPP